MKLDKLKEKMSAAKDKTVELAKKVGAKNMIILSAVLVCVIAIGLNFILADNSVPANEDGYVIDPDLYASMLEDETESVGVSGEASEEDDGYFDAAVLNRDRARDEAIEVLSTVAQSDTALDDVKNKAEADIAAIAAAIEAESNIEELVKAKGFSECVAVINGDLASVIVRSDGLLPSEVAQITEIVFEQSGILPINLNIIEK